VRALSSDGSEGVEFRVNFMRPFSPRFWDWAASLHQYLLTSDHCGETDPAQQVD
jgi:hypothetical protein